MNAESIALVTISKNSIDINIESGCQYLLMIHSKLPLYQKPQFRSMKKHIGMIGNLLCAHMVGKVVDQGNGNISLLRMTGVKGSIPFLPSSNLLLCTGLHDGVRLFESGNMQNISVMIMSS